jgi:hypothetical protein
MDGPGIDATAPLDPASEFADEAAPAIEGLVPSSRTEDISLEALAMELERDPGECWRAFLGLESIDVETRLRIIDGLAGLSAGPGITGLLELLAASGDDRSRTAALEAIERLMHVHPDSEAREIAPFLADPEEHDHKRSWERTDGATGRSRRLVWQGETSHPLLVQSLVTPVDGTGRGAIGVSTSKHEGRVTAIFLCDVERGVLGAVGQIEEESPQAGALLREFRAQAAGPGVDDAGELALGLLAGAMMLNRPSIPEPVRQWLDESLGRGFHPRPLPARISSGDKESIGNGELLLRAEEILEACPSWLDSSALTFELAEEIVLREGKTSADPQRDSGAFRFLFEHRIIHRLEHYGRTLLWMSRFWEYRGEPDLAWSAQTLAMQLLDDQYAVPGHPFTVALTARSLIAAQDRLGSGSDPRSARLGE